MKCWAALLEREVVWGGTSRAVLPPHTAEDTLTLLPRKGRETRTGISYLAAKQCIEMSFLFAQQEKQRGFSNEIAAFKVIRTNTEHLIGQALKRRSTMLPTVSFVSVSGLQLCRPGLINLPSLCSLLQLPTPTWKHSSPTCLWCLVFIHYSSYHL